jgi:methionine synthase / methylenetetrahydrofolate reductase(NADPH)
MKGLDKEAGAREGLAIAKEFIDATITAVGGYYLIPPFGKCELAVELIEHIQQRKKEKQP